MGYFILGDYPTVDRDSWECYPFCMIKLSQLNALFATEEACKEFLFKHRWPDGVRCPRCGNDKVYTPQAAVEMAMSQQDMRQEGLSVLADQRHRV
jgi:hypothetical protein